MVERASEQPRPLEWIGSSKKDLLALPDEVIDVFGYALQLAQTGKMHSGENPSAASVLRACWRSLRTCAATLTVPYTQ